MAININTSNCLWSGLLHSLWDILLVFGHARRLSALANLTNVAHSLHASSLFAPKSGNWNRNCLALQFRKSNTKEWKSLPLHTMSQPTNRHSNRAWRGLEVIEGICSRPPLFTHGLQLATNELWSAPYGWDFVAFCRRCFIARHLEHLDLGISLFESCRGWIHRSLRWCGARTGSTETVLNLLGQWADIAFRKSWKPPRTRELGKLD